MTTRIRVLQVAWRYSRGGGKTQVARDLIKYHDPAIVEMHAFSMRPLYSEDDLGELGNNVTFHTAGIADHRGRSGALRGVPALTRAVRRIRPDVVHLHAGWDWWLAPSLLLPRRPAVLVEVHDPPGTGKATTKHARFFRVFVRRFAALPLTHSTWTQAETARWLGIPNDSVELVPLGTDLSEPAPTPEQRAEARRRLELPADGPVVGYVARLVPSKRPELFVDVAREVLRTHPDTTFALAGKGVLDEAVATRAADLGRSFRQLGYVERVADVHAASDIYCSTSGYEGFGLAVADAMATQVATVAAAVGGLVDVVGPAGLLVHDADAFSLASAVRHLLDDDRLRESLASAAEARVRERFDVRDFVRATERVWLSLVSGRTA